MKHVGVKYEKDTLKVKLPIYFHGKLNKYKEQYNSIVG